MADIPTPLSLDLDRQKELRIRWVDGVMTRIPLAELRRACPCATCRAAREERQRNPLAVLQGGPAGMDAVIARDAEIMGNYALRITWNDGHNTGIYQFSMLREMGRNEGS